METFVFFGLLALYTFNAIRIAQLRKSFDEKYESLYKEFHGLNLHVRGNMELSNRATDQIKRLKQPVEKDENEGLSQGYKMLCEMKPAKFKRDKSQ